MPFVDSRMVFSLRVPPLWLAQLLSDNSVADVQPTGNAISETCYRENIFILVGSGRQNAI